MRKATSTFPDAPRTSSFRVAITSIPPSKRPLKPFRVPTVIGVPHADFGEAIVAIVAPKAGPRSTRRKFRPPSPRAPCKIQAAQTRLRDQRRNTMGKNPVEGPPRDLQGDLRKSV